MNGAIGVVIMGAIVILAIIPSVVAHLTYNDVMKQAFDRGYAVQCVGKTGYYWECEE